MFEQEIEELPVWARFPVRQMQRRIEELEAAIKACPRICGYGAHQLNPTGRDVLVEKGS